MYLYEVNSKFQNNRHYGCKPADALCFALSHITQWNNSAAVKINEAVGKRIWKATKIRYVVHSKYHLFAFHQVQLIGFRNIRELRLCSTVWKSSLRVVHWENLPAARTVLPSSVLLGLVAKYSISSNTLLNKLTWVGIYFMMLWLNKVVETLPYALFRIYWNGNKEVWLVDFCDGPSWLSWKHA